MSYRCCLVLCLLLGVARTASADALDDLVEEDCINRTKAYICWKRQFEPISDSTKEKMLEGCRVRKSAPQPTK